MGTSQVNTHGAGGNAFKVPAVTLGRSGIVSSRLGLGCAGWPSRSPYETVVEVFRAAFAAGIRHVDVAAKYGTEEIVGRALKDAGAPADRVLATKCGSYGDELGISYREYSAETVYRSVERSLKLLQVDHFDIVHVHDCEPSDLPFIFGKRGAVHGLAELKRQGVVRSIGMGTYTLRCLQAAVDSGEVDQIQSFHTYTLLNQDATRQLIPSARARNLGLLNNAPYAGYILMSGAVPGATYVYAPARPEVMEAVRRIEAVCARKGVSLATAALAFSLQNPAVDVTVIGASSPEKLRERIAAFNAPLTAADFQEMIDVAAGSYGSSWDGDDCRPYNAASFDFIA
jgi:D-threo-aldose 1-dehydrogenase